MAKKKISAGAMDIRNIIGALMTIYGIILVIWGALQYSQIAADKTGGVNADLWVGLALLVLGSVLIAWAKMRPQVVEVSLEELRAAEAEAAKAEAEANPMVDPNVATESAATVTDK